MVKKQDVVTKLPPPPVERGEVLKWFVNQFGVYKGANRGLFVSDFSDSDEAALESALFTLKSEGAKGGEALIVTGENLYNQAEQIFVESDNAGFGRPIATNFEKELATSPLVVIRDLKPPSNQAQLWYLHSYLLYPRVMRDKAILITTSLGYEEFMAAGLGVPDSNFAGRPITWEKIVWLFEASMINLSLFAMTRDAGLPPMLKAEYYLWMSLMERGMPVIPQYVLNEHMLDLALMGEDKKLDIKCGGISWADSEADAVDAQRFDLLLSNGWQSLSFTTAEILNNYTGCAEVVQEFWLTGKKRKKPGRLISNSNEIKIPLGLPKNMVEDGLETSAILHAGGPAALTGAAGTGKTTCLSERVVHLLDQGVDPSSILVVSFGSETIKPIEALLAARLDSPVFEKLTLASWRQLGEKILGDNLSALKRKSPLKLEANKHKVLQRILAKYEKELDPATIDLSNGFDEFTISSIISIYKNRLFSAAEAKEKAKGKVEETIAKIYQAYEDQLQRSNKFDEDDLITQSVNLLLDRSDVRVRYQNQFEYILVDEFQDVTPAQAMLVRIIAAPQDNLFVAGDDDQALFGNRGASAGIFADLSRIAPQTKCYFLAKNWRSDCQIAELSAKSLSLLDPEKRRIAKALIAGWQPIDRKVIIGPESCADEKAEADFVAQEIKKLLEAGRRPSEMAIVYGHKRYRGIIEDGLTRQGLGFVSEDIDVLKPDEITDMLSYLRLIVDPDGPRAREDFERICQIRYKDVDPKLSSTINSFAEANNLSFLRAVEIYSEATADKSCKELEQLVRIIRTMHQENLPPAETIALVKRTQRLSDHYNSIKLPPHVYYEPMAKLTELENTARGFVSVAEFLKRTMAARQAASEQGSAEKVPVLSVEETKGKEFPVVFLVGLSEGTFPASDSEEEKKLLYVALSRAQQLLYLSYPRRVKDGLVEASKYLTELSLVESVVPTVVVAPPPVPKPVKPTPPPAPKLVEAPSQTPKPPTPVKVEPPAPRLVEPPIQKPIVPTAKPAEPKPKPPVPRISQPIPQPVQPVVQVTPKVEPSPPTPAFTKCPACGAIIEGEAKFCGECGLSTGILTQLGQGQNTAYTVQPKANACPACAAEIEAGAKFCGECGFKTG